MFMGSEQYPYKGILDSIANRSFANGSKLAQLAAARPSPRRR